MKNETRDGLGEFAALYYLQPGDACFERTSGGMLSLRSGPDAYYPRVNLFRAFPFTKDGEYISVRDDEGKEIGIIRSLAEFPADVAALLKEELDRRYFLPIIQRIFSIKEEFGYVYWDVQTDAGLKRFTIRRDHNSVIHIQQKRVLIIDVDGNRFEIVDYSKMDAKSYKMIEMLL